MSPLTHPSQALVRFPEYLLLPSHPLFRIHQAIYRPWWFSSGSPLRFDLSFPNGTCYVAEEDLGAFVEAFQDWTGAIIPAVEVFARRISTLSVPQPMRLADCTNPHAHAFGITAEIHSSPDRRLTQEWAAAVHRAGFAGVRFFVRHDPAQRRAGVALFGPAGEAAWHVGSTQDIAGDLLDRAEAEFGIRIG